MTTQHTAADLAIAHLVNRAAARVQPTTNAQGKHAGRFGEKAFISAVWAELTTRALPEYFPADLAQLKAWLIRGQRDGLVVLARADLIAAMDYPSVQASEISDRGAEFHFVRVG